jgi:gliding motility-associated-like protein
VAYAGPDQVVCWDDTLFLRAAGLDTVGNGYSGTYRWWDVTSSAPLDINLGPDSVLEFQIRQTTDYKLDLYVTQDTTTCFDNDTVSVLVNPLPILNLPSDMVECCDVGFLNLNKNLTPKGGNWYSTKDPSYVDLGYRFNSNLACNPDAKTSHFVTYEYTDLATGCINRDSLNIALNPLPRLELANGYFCQDKATVNLDEILVLPAKLTGPSRTVNCLDCGNYNFSNILSITGPTFDQQFSFDISPSGMNLGSKDVDSIIIELIYGDANGCFVRDTATIIVTKVPQIKFLAIPDMCWDEGKVDLKQRTAVTPTDGFWFCYDTTLAMPGFRYCADSFMNGALTNSTFAGDTINTLATNSLGGTYYMRYMHTRSGCPTFRDTFMTINPLPKPVIDVSVLDDNLASGYVPPPYLFCEDRTDISLVASPSGGIWSSPHSGVVAGNTFKPSSSPTKAPFYITYLYTDANGCEGKDSAQVEIEAKPTLSLSLSDSSLCRTENMNIDISATYTNSPSVDWFPITGGAVSDPTGDDVNYTFSTANDTTHVHVLVARTKEGNACPYTEERFIAQIHPVPDAAIAPDDPDGCQPHFANMTTTFFNKVDPGTSTYEWNFGDGGTDASQNPSYSFSQVGVNDVTLKITTIHGCDTTLTMPITVHPIPVANFTPNPNNSTTAALPKFQFNNESSISSGSIISNLWEFGQVVNDTSSLTSPTHIYLPDTGTYYVTLKVESEFGCRDSITKPVIIGPDILVFIPNAFSPDGGGPNQNDGFRAEVNDAIRDYHLIVFNRWGEILWESKDPSQRWDGNYKGLPAQQDVYAYHLNVTSWDEKTYRFNGTVTLLR